MIGVRVRDEVAAASADGAAVALESTIFSNLGLPSPANREALDRVIAAVERHGAVPALTAVLDGEMRVGVDPSEHPRILGEARKVAARDIAVATAQNWEFGATTVSASLTLAHAVGLRVFATGGIGGVHRGWNTTADVSADLDTLARLPVITVSAGAKVFLDLPATLEYLETRSVPVLGWQTDTFPAFHSRSSGLPVPHRVDTATEVAAIAREHWALGGGGLLVVAPVPQPDEIPLSSISSSVDLALAAAAGEVGAAITPAVLAALADATDGQSVPTNLSLAENNADVAARIAVAMSQS